MEEQVILDVEKRAGVRVFSEKESSSDTDSSKNPSSSTISPQVSAAWKLSCKNANSSIRLSSTVMLEADADLLLDDSDFWDGRKRSASSISILIMSWKVGKDAQMPVGVVPILSTLQFPSAAPRRRKLRVVAEVELWANMLGGVGGCKSIDMNWDEIWEQPEARGNIHAIAPD